MRERREKEMEEGRRESVCVTRKKCQTMLAVLPEEEDTLLLPPMMIKLTIEIKKKLMNCWRSKTGRTMSLMHIHITFSDSSFRL